MNIFFRILGDKTTYGTILWGITCCNFLCPFHKTWAIAW